jgi:hypothetical protein
MKAATNFSVEVKKTRDRPFNRVTSEKNKENSKEKENVGYKKFGDLVCYVYGLKDKQ